jgi:hypothetical protein
MRETLLCTKGFLALFPKNVDLGAARLSQMESRGINPRILTAEKNMYLTHESRCGLAAPAFL